MTRWRAVRDGLESAFPGSRVRVLPRPGIGPGVLQVYLEQETYVIDRNGIRSGPADLHIETTLSRIFGHPDPDAASDDTEPSLA